MSGKRNKEKRKKEKEKEKMSESYSFWMKGTFEILEKEQKEKEILQRAEEYFGAFN